MSKKILYLLLVFPALVLAQSTDQNYVKSITYKQPTTSVLSSPNLEQATIQISYFDGLGRPIQQIAHKQSNSGKDIVTHIEYDAFGRQTKEFLPFANTTASQDYMSSASTELATFYNTYNGGTTNPFSQKELEASPLNRVFKQAAPGDAWALGQGKEIKFDYQTNTSADNVKLFSVTATWDAAKGLYDIPTSVTPTTYADFQLYKTITYDENTPPSGAGGLQEFKDKEGKVVLKRAYNSTPSSGAGGLHDTYYIYDQYGNLTFVLPPLAEGIATQTVLDNLGYQYKYDARNRLVEKKLPGKQWEFIVYDKLDRPVATGPAFSPYGDQTIGWMVTQYDVFGRVTQTGWKQMTVTTATRTTNQTNINNGGNPFALANNQILTKNYYDNYSFTGAPNPLPTLIENQIRATNVKGLPTGSWVKVLDNATSTTAEVSYTVYDHKYRPVHTKTTNHLGGYTQVDTHLDWAGKTLYTQTKHKRTNADTELIVKDRFSYSDQDKLLVHKQQINTLPEQLITKNTYDELGQLTSKNVGGTDVTGNTALQTVDYKYNIRGWLKAINDVNSIGNDLFAFNINYNDAESATKLYNGNISETHWKTSTDNVKRKYDYKYDDLNRLLQADYSKEANYTFNSYLEHLSYDKNGNIKTLLRNGGMDTDGLQFANPIDNLTYFYDTDNKNLLLKVTDDSFNPQGFKDGTNTDNDYSYDDNGNLTKDNNKNIKTIKYNHLNLPTQIIFVNGNKISYLYNATGQKVRKSIDEIVNNQAIFNQTDYLAGFQYHNTVLKHFPHAEGYVNVVKNTTSYEFKYVFNYTDHLGNIRLSYSKDPTSNVLKILEENHYYPFGLKHSGYNSDRLVLQISTEYSKFNNWQLEEVVIKPFRPTSFNLSSNYDYKYNGKEYQDELGLNVTAMDFRQYDSAIGRFNGMDRLAELTHSITPYRFALNNPNYFNDPSGLTEEGGNRLMGWVNNGSTIFWDPKVNNQEDVDRLYGGGNTYVPDNTEVIDVNGSTKRLNPDGTITTILNEVEIVATRKAQNSNSNYHDISMLFRKYSGYALTIQKPLGEAFANGTRYPSQLYPSHTSNVVFQKTILGKKVYVPLGNYNTATVGKMSKALKITGKTLGVVAVGTGIYSIANDGLNISNGLDTTMALLALSPTGVGQAIAGSYFLLNTISQLATGKDLGQHIQEQIDGK